MKRINLVIMDDQGRESSINRARIIKELEEKGYAVVPNVLTVEECDGFINQYREWLRKFGDDNPAKWNSLIQVYRVSHSQPAWEIRLKAKPVFSALWGTEKLLSSMDGMAIGEPPENGNTPFNTPGDNWFHIDQGSWRIGLHAYQGAVYLEETTVEDYCFRVIEGSHVYHKEFLDTFKGAAKRSAGQDFFRLRLDYLNWYKEKGLNEKKVPVPKGGMVLWDSRTIHDNVKPEEGRQHSDRWRFVVFVCMTPAKWTTKRDLELKKEAVEEMVATAHWPSRGVWLFPSTSDHSSTWGKPKIEMVDTLPEIVKTEDVRLLIGLDEYDFDDGKPNDLGWEPEWLVEDTNVESSAHFS